MKYEIWINEKRQLGFMCEELEGEEREVFEGYECVHSYDANTVEEAQKKFIEYVQIEQPDVKVERTDLSRLKGGLIA